MADADAVTAALAGRDGVAFSALTMNRRGLERAMAAGAKQVATVVAATDQMNRNNINMSLEEAIAAGEAVLGAAREAGLATRAYIAVAFECPFESPVATAAVLTLTERFASLGADEIVIADTIGAAAPGQVSALLRALLQSLPADRLGMHFHDTRGLGTANAYVAMEAGIRRFDASAGGIGGCPFAPGAAGNLATENLVLMAEGSGMGTGINLEAMAATVDFATGLLKRELGGRCMPWLKRRIAAHATS